MTTYCYSKIVCNISPEPSSFEASESKKTYHVLTERHLQAMWLEQKYFKSLTTTKGEPIEVLSPGIWNSEAGPDFLKAHIKIGNVEWRGDIELHLSQEGWMHHHHHEDSRYDAVILHVCYWEPIKERPILTSKGKSIPSAFLNSCLTIPEARLLKLIDLDLYPYKIFTGSGRCSRMFFSKMTRDEARDLLHSAALWRLEEKWNRLQTTINSPELALLGGISMALGYKNNAEAFLSLFHAFCHHNAASEAVLFSMALASCGFFEPFFEKKWGQSPFYHSLKEQSGAIQDNRQKITLRLDHIRPANHPVRRLAFLAKMLADPRRHTLNDRLWHCWHSNWHGATVIPSKDPEKVKRAPLHQKWKRMKELLIRELPIYSDPYWEFHYLFENRPLSKPLALVGEDLYREILINVVLPFLYTKIKQNDSAEERHAFEEFYAHLPSSKTKKGTYLGHRFFGETQKKLTLLHANTQQGAYQIHRDFCVHYEASCQGCQFVELNMRLL